MVVNGPFLNWFEIENPSRIAQNAGIYCLKNARGEQVMAVAAIRQDGGQMVYRALHQFVDYYPHLLPEGNVLEWNFSCLVVAWLDTIVYHSFLWHSIPGVGHCWYLKTLSPAGVPELLPQALEHFFPPDDGHVWVLLKHGARAWPVEIANHEFRQGWDEFCQSHLLEPGHKVILSCERCWVFETTIFDASGDEFVYGWSAPNHRWRSLHAPLNNLRTAFRPSVLANEETIVKFRYVYNSVAEMKEEFERVMNPVFQNLRLEAMAIKMAGRSWTVQINNMQLDDVAFYDFAHALDLQQGEYVFVVLLHTVEFHVIVFDNHAECEKTYEWF